MAQTKEQLEAGIASLNVAIAAGVRSVTLGGQTVTYNTGASLIAARDSLQNQLNGLTGNRKRRIGYITYGGRGYDR